MRAKAVQYGDRVLKKALRANLYMAGDINGGDDRGFSLTSDF
jgi:hypothetical protein